MSDEAVGQDILQPLLSVEQDLRVLGPPLHHYKIGYPTLAGLQGWASRTYPAAGDQISVAVVPSGENRDVWSRIGRKEQFDNGCAEA